MDKYGVAAYYRALVHLEQHPYESTYDYLERTKYYANKCPYPVLQLHEIIIHFLDGMLPKERYMMDIMAGGSIMDRTPIEVWHLIEDRAANTRPYTEYSSEPTFEELVHEITTQAVQPGAPERTKLLAKMAKRLLEIERMLGEKAEDVHELESAPAPTQVSLDDEKVIVLTEEQAEEKIMDEELQVVPITSVEDVPTEESSTPQCSDLIIKQDTVITCNPIILPISDILVFPHVQNDIIQKALRNIQVWGSLEKVTIHIPMTRNPMRMQKSEQFLESSCKNWKFQKKRRDRMRGSSGKTISYTHSTTQRREKLHNGLRKTWKRRKKGKHNLLNGRPMFYVFLQESHYSTFGWKPGWNACRSVSHQVARDGMKPVRKFDGVHPWAPNIC